MIMVYTNSNKAIKPAAIKLKISFLQNLSATNSVYFSIFVFIAVKYTPIQAILKENAYVTKRKALK